MFDNKSKKQPKNEIKYEVVLTEEQKLAKEQILDGVFTFLTGKAGTSKTFLACAVALDLVFKKQAERIIITRPTVATEDNGFLPGTFEEKMEPWLVPIWDNIKKIYNNEAKLKKMKEEGQIKVLSLSHFRGHSFENSICIIDEFQNLTVNQLKMALGRLGKGSMMIFCGDKYQIDLKYKQDSAVNALDRLNTSKYVKIIELFENHRHEAVEEVLNLLD
jgi:phosphate starvation-inducible PhoH-like protein